MCGIVGIISEKIDGTEKTLIKKMADSLQHRGPDGDGFYFDAMASLAHRRLAIIDLVSGKQPMTTTGGRFTITFNGEIYNFQDLRHDLEKSGTVFKTHSDTEVLLELFARDGEKCLQKLNGMFAFAIWDSQEKKLFAARDRAGKKPFYYTQVRDHFIFASELKALLEHPLVSRTLDPESVRLYLTYECIPAPKSIFENIYKLPQAHFLTYQNKRTSITRYWKPPFDDKIDISENEAGKILLEKIDRATAARLLSDVPLGVFLSGGIDSSSIVALMARHREGKNIKTFSIAFEEASYDESDYASDVAKKFGTDHSIEILSAGRMLKILPEVANFLDEPFADGSILPTYLLAEFTRRHVTVALGGDGADEHFAGYPTFFASRLADVYQKFPKWILKPFEKLVDFLPASEKNMSLDFKVRQFLLGARQPALERAQTWLAAIPPREQNHILENSFWQKTKNKNPFDLLSEEMQHGPKSERDKLLYFYQKFYMCDMVLTKVDRASMANSLEVRAPYLDVNVMEFADRLPYEFKLKGVTTKYLLKKIFNGILPHHILHRPKKGFGIPITGWLKKELRPLMNDLLNSERLTREGIFNPHYVERLIREHSAGFKNHRKPLFTILMFQLWREKYL